jgi:heavy-metal-associated domain-containing protein
VADGRSDGRSQAVVLDIVHASPGRIRLREHADPRHPGLNGTNGTFDAARSLLERVDGVESVRAVPLAHSLVVEFDPDAESVDEVLSSIEGAGVQLEPAPEPSGPTGDRPSSVGDAIAQWGSFADRRLSQISGRTLDARTVMPLTFAALAARAYIKGPRAGPPWHTLAWYAFDSFTKLRSKNTE